ncbi:MAG TPA: hypothetical protein VHZ03_30315 [Trebonia sp.]|nr:hypothetical protein [Trebonia sp.]
MGKTRLAIEVARNAADDFPDGVYFVGLGAVSDGARVPDEVAASLGIRQAHGRSSEAVLAEALATRRLLLVLDNCEHVLPATAQLCGGLLTAADDICILATSRERLWVGGEARCRLAPLALPASADQAAISESEAVALFAERARQVDPMFDLTAETRPLVAHVVARLDGMPLAIELAAARVEALGMARLAQRIDDALRLLNTKDSTAAARHQSLAAVAAWSYRLLSASEQRVFRRLSMFPGPFTLEAAEAVAGPEAGPSVLRLVDCSLVTPARPGPDSRLRYTMLETLRAYARDQLVKAGEAEEATAGVVRFALAVAEDAWAGMQTRGRGRMVDGYERLTAAVGQATSASPGWARAQLRLGYLSRYGDLADSLAHYTAAYTVGDPGEAVDALVGRAFRQLNNGLTGDADPDARQQLTLATEAGYPAGQAQALAVLALESDTARRPGFEAEALAMVRQARNSLAANAPGWLDRWCGAVVMTVLFELGDLAAARTACAEELPKARAAGDLATLVNLLAFASRTAWLAGAMAEVRAHVREATNVAFRIGDRSILHYFIDECAELCAATGYRAAALTLWAALEAEKERRDRRGAGYRRPGPEPGTQAEGYRGAPGPGSTAGGGARRADDPRRRRRVHAHADRAPGGRASPADRRRARPGRALRARAGTCHPGRPGAD